MFGFIICNPFKKVVLYAYVEQVKYGEDIQPSILNLFILPILFDFAFENAQGGENLRRSFSRATQGAQQKKRDMTGVITPLVSLFPYITGFSDRQNKKVPSGFVSSTEYLRV